MTDRQTASKVRVPRQAGRKIKKHTLNLTVFMMCACALLSHIDRRLCFKMCIPLTIKAKNQALKMCTLTCQRYKVINSHTKCRSTHCRICLCPKRSGILPWVWHVDTECHTNQIYFGSSPKEILWLISDFVLCNIWIFITQTTNTPFNLWRKILWLSILVMQTFYVIFRASGMAMTLDQQTLQCSLMGKSISLFKFWFKIR